MALTQISDAGLKTPASDLQDDEKIVLGTGNDLEIFHDGSNSYVAETGTGALILGGGSVGIMNAAGTENNIWCTENGSVSLYYDNAKKLETTSAGVTVTGAILTTGNIDAGANNFLTDDNGIFSAGTAGDLQILHDGSASIIKHTNAGNDFYIQSDSHIRFTDIGGNETFLKLVNDGAVELYHNNVKKFETSAAGGSMHGNLYFDDSGRADFGAGSDLKIYHDGTNSVIENTTGELQIKEEGLIRINTDDFRVYKGNGTELLILAQGDDAVKLYYDNSKKFETTSSGVSLANGADGTISELRLAEGNAASKIATIKGTTSSTNEKGIEFKTYSFAAKTPLTLTHDGHLNVPDSSNIQLGDSQDCKIYHDGSHTYMLESGTGHLLIGSSLTHITNAAGTENCAKFTEDGAVELYHNGASRMNTATNGVYFPERVLIKTTSDTEESTSTSALVVGCDAAWATHASKVYVTKTDYAEGGGGISMIGCVRSANSAYTFMGMYSGNGTTFASDREFNFLGDGYAYADGSWTGSGADYAEFFEWKDGNASAEDRVGISVVLDGDKIKEASAGEEPIGVISGNPVVVGDAAWNKWTDKYLKDDYGRYVWETYTITEWTNSDGNLEQYETDRIPSGVTAPSDATVKTKDEKDNILTRRKANPSYDPSKTYTTREDRKEWDTVGLVGKLRVKKGQVTGSSWIKMRDISSNVEEWLVK